MSRRNKFVRTPWGLRRDAGFALWAGAEL